MKKHPAALWAFIVVALVAVVGAAVYLGKPATQKGTFRLPPITTVPLEGIKRLKPDLTVNRVESGTIPSRGANFTVKNIGALASGPFYVKIIRLPTNFESATNPPVSSSFSAVRGLAVGEERLVDTQEVDFAHTNALAIGIDLDNRVDESNETNNYFMWSKEVPSMAPFTTSP